MPPPIGDDELKLKQRARRRLIGAIVLLSVLVLVLPLVLDKAPKHASNEIAMHIPAPQQTPTNPEWAAPESKPEVVHPPEPEVNISSPAAPLTTEIAPPVPAEKPVKPAANHGFFVQVGVFSKSENAKSVQAKLAKINLTASVQSIKTSGGESTRVRIGPFETRIDADEVLSQVKRLGEKNATIVKVERPR